MGNGAAEKVGMGAKVIIAGFGISLAGVYMTKAGTTWTSISVMSLGVMILCAPAFWDWVRHKFF